MSLPVPVLDSKTFDELASEAQALIPRVFPAWTDRNPSDPGITLLELFAFLAEAAYYQLDRVPSRTLRHFAELAGTTGSGTEPVGGLLCRSVLARQAVNRAVTPADSEFVARSGIVTISPPLPRDLDSGTPVLALTAQPGAVTLATPALAGDVSVTVTDSSSLRVGDLLLLDGAGPGAEFTTVAGVSLPAGTAIVTLGAPLASPHAAQAPLARMSPPAGTSASELVEAATAGAAVLAIEPSAGLPSGWLRLGGAGAVAAPMYVQAAGVARTKVVTQSVSSANVYPADLLTTVLVVPGDGSATPSAPLLQAVFDLLRSRSPITTRIRVAAPGYCQVRVAATVVRAFPALLRKDTVQQGTQAALQRFLDPVHGGEDGQGWPFGRAVYRSELYQVLQDTTGVDHVRGLLLNGDPEAEALPLHPDPAQASTSLVRLTDAAVTVVDS